MCETFWGHLYLPENVSSKLPIYHCTRVWVSLLPLDYLCFPCLCYVLGNWISLLHRTQSDNKTTYFMLPGILSEILLPGCTTYSSSMFILKWLQTFNNRKGFFINKAYREKRFIKEEMKNSTHLVICVCPLPSSLAISLPKVSHYTYMCFWSTYIWWYKRLYK